MHEIAFIVIHHICDMKRIIQRMNSQDSMWWQTASSHCNDDEKSTHRTILTQNLLFQEEKFRKNFGFSCKSVVDISSFLILIVYIGQIFQRWALNLLISKWKVVWTTQIANSTISFFEINQNEIPKCIIQMLNRRKTPVYCKPLVIIWLVMTSIDEQTQKRSHWC